MVNDGDQEEEEFDDKHHKHQPKKIAFKLLSRDQKGRIETRQLMVPEENEMAVKLMKAGAEQRIEKERLKQRVLEINSMNAELEVLILPLMLMIADVSYRVKERTSSFQQALWVTPLF